MKLFIAIREILRGMPRGIQLITLLCCWISLCIPAAFVPLPADYYVVDGENISFIEFWRRGFGPLFVGIGFLSASVAYGFIRARPWSRVLFVAWVSGFIGFGIFAGGKVDARAVVSGTCVLAFVLWYFFYRRGVRDYFRQNHDTAS